MYKTPYNFCFIVLHLFLANETWTLARFLPILISDLVPMGNRHWNLYLLLLKIVELVMAPKVTVAIAAYLRQLIQEHHTIFSELYPGYHLTPKLHYMIHIPSWIVE